MDSRLEVVYVDEGGPQRGERRDGRHGADDPAFILYTSRTTKDRKA